MTAVKLNKARNQEEFRVAAKMKLIELGLTVKALSQKVGASRTATSQAINHGLHSGVLAAVRKELSL